VVPREINNFSALGQQARDMLDDLHVGLRPIALAELPHINNVTIQNEGLGGDGLEIAKKLLCMASVSAQVNVGKDNQFQFPFLVFSQV